MSRAHLVAAILVCSMSLIPDYAAAQEIQLDEIQIKGNGLGDAATGPVSGYVAKESATGTKTATKLLETPQSISVVGAKEIRDLGAQSVDQAVRYVSGVRADTFGNDTRNDWYLIRGFPGQISGYFLDSLQLYSNAFATFRIEPWGLERLEILKGPASVLYGGSNVGGIINAVSKRPPDVAQGSIEIGVNNYGNRYAAFDVGGPVSQAPNNDFYYRLEGLARGGGTQTDFTKDDRLYIAPSLTWAPDGDTRITVLGSYQKDRTNGQNFLPYVGTVVAAPYGKIPTSLFTSEPGYDTFQRSQALIGYEVEHRLNENVTVRQNMRYSNLKIDFQTLYGFASDPATAELSRLNFATTPLVGEVALDNQLEARFHTGPVAHTTLFGLDYKHYTLSDDQAAAVGTPLNLLRPVYATAVAPLTSQNIYLLNNETQDQIGVYAQEQAKLGRLTLVLSGRHDSLTTSLINKLAATRTDSADQALTGRVGLIYDTDIHLAPYGTIATSFDPQLGTNAATGKALVPTTGILKEIGVKYEPVPNRLLLTGALFDLTQNNVLTTDPTNVMNSIQTGQEQSRGFELQAQGNMTEALTVLGSYTGYRLRNTKDENLVEAIGKVPVNTPQNFGSLLLDYTIQGGALRGLGFGAGPRYVGGSYADVGNTVGVPAYILGDALVHYQRDHWRASVNISNFTNRTYVSSCQTVNACFYGTKRVVLGRLAYSW